MSFNDVNSVEISGNLSSDPDLKYTPSGMAICEVSLAYNKRVKQQNGEYNDKASFHSLKLFGKSAEYFQQQMRKGSHVYIKGELSQETWTDKQGGKKSATRILVDKYLEIAARERSDRQESQQPPPAPTFTPNDRPNPISNDGTVDGVPEDCPF